MHGRAYGAHILCHINVNVHGASPDIPESSADCTIHTSGIGKRSLTVLPPLGRIQHLCILLLNYNQSAITIQL